MLKEGRWVPTFPRARYYMARTELEIGLVRLILTRVSPRSSLPLTILESVEGVQVPGSFCVQADRIAAISLSISAVQIG
jgi:hypothetical protein